MKYLYKYPQRAFPYADLVATNRARGRRDFEYELIDTSVFDDDRYFDVFVEYAKESPRDLLVKITVHNRGPEPAELHVLPTLWFRDPWSWSTAWDRPSVRRVGANGRWTIASAEGHLLGRYHFHCDGDVPLLFTENETNMQRIFGTSNRPPHVKDGINDYVVLGKQDAVSPEERGTKVASHDRLVIDPGGHRAIRLRLTEVGTAEPSQAHGGPGPFGAPFEDTLRLRREEADEFYAAITPPALDDDAANVMRQALAGGKMSYGNGRLVASMSRPDGP